MARDEPLLPVTGADLQPRWRQLIVACYLPSSLCFFNYGLGLLGLPLLCKSWHIPIAAVAYLKTVSEIAETAFSLPASTAAIRYGARGTLLIGSACYTLASFGLAHVPEFASLACGYFCQSGAVKLINRGRSITMKDVPKAFYGRTNGYLMLLRCVCTSIAPFALSLMLQLPAFSNNIQRIFLLQTFLGVLMILSISADMNTGAPTENQKKKLKGESMRDQLQEEISYRDMMDGECGSMLVRTVGLCSCISMLIGSYNILLPVVSLALDIPVTMVSLSMTVCYGVAGALSVLGGSSVDRFGRRPAMITSMLLFAVGHAILALLALVDRSRAALVLFPAAVLLGTGDAIAAPLRGVLKNDNADCVKTWAELNSKDQKAAIAKSFGLLDVLLDLVGVFYPIVLGLCATYLSGCITSCLFAAIAMIGAFWVVCLPSDF